MSKVLCEKSDLVAIADSIRSKTGSTDGMKVAEIPQKIEAIETGSNINIQASKSITYTSNGTATITPDAGYDALSSVDVTVNVASVSTVTINCEGNDSSAFWLSPDGVFHKKDLKAGANTIIVTPYSPIGVYNTYGYNLINMNNIVRR